MARSAVPYWMQQVAINVSREPDSLRPETSGQRPAALSPAPRAPSPESRAPALRSRVRERCRFGGGRDARGIIESGQTTPARARVSPLHRGHTRHNPPGFLGGVLWRARDHFTTQRFRASGGTDSPHGMPRHIRGAYGTRSQATLGRITRRRLAD